MALQLFGQKYLQINNMQVNNIQVNNVQANNLVKNIHINSQTHFYRPYCHFVTTRETPFIDILAASKIRPALLKCAAFLNRLRM